MAYHTAWADDYSNQIPDSDAASAQFKVSNWNSSVVVHEADDGSGPVCLPSVSFSLQNLGSDISGTVVHVDFLNLAAKSVFSSNDYDIDSIPSGFSKEMEIDAQLGAGAAAGGCAGLPPLTAKVTVQNTVIAEGEINPTLPGESSDNSQQAAPTSPAPPAKFDPAAIQKELMPCWPFDVGTPGLPGFRVHLQLNTDGQGTVRRAEVAPEDQKKMKDPTFSGFASQAITAVTNYWCSTLPLPSSMLGKPQKIDFLFNPNS